MKQVLQMLSNGETVIADVPSPSLRSNHVLVQTHLSLMSAGTERMLVEFGKAGLLDKARQQPDKVRDVIDKVRTDGLIPTYEAVRSKLDQPIALGYCNVGVVCEGSKSVDDLRMGDRVVSNGAHAGVVCVSRNLCAKIPDSVNDETAAFAVLGAIGMQGIRLAEPTIGECVVVSGLGLIGLLTVQILVANGCRVLATDYAPVRLALAKEFGADVVDLSRGEELLDRANEFSRGRGVDAVIITASTKSSDPVAQAARMSRKRGRIVLVGVTGLELSRADFYEKELSFRVSCSYGPGRYDQKYEEKGQDYPLGFVRWTARRNMESVLDLMAAGSIRVEKLITHRFDIDSAQAAYRLLTSDESSIGIVLEFGESSSTAIDRRVDLVAKPAPISSDVSLGVIGAGNYAGRVLIPAFRQAGADLHMLVSGGGVSSAHHGGLQGFRIASTDADAAFADDQINTIVIATRHDSHATYAEQGLVAGKNVFVEKPLCLTNEELDGLEKLLASHTSQLLMVGFNRRFSPLALRADELLKSVVGPKSMVVTVNAGKIPANHWTQDPAIGGGRIVGEACHFIDLLRFFAKSRILKVAVAGSDDGRRDVRDNVSISLEFEDGSHGVVHYLTDGNSGYPKERVEIFCGGRILQLNNFKSLRGWGWQKFSSMRLWRQDKGQRACAAAFVDAIQNGCDAPISLEDILEVSRFSIEAQELLS